MSPGLPFRFRRPVPFIPQMEAVECGAASLAMVLASYGHHVPLPELRQACGASRDGVNALAILRAARAYGLEAQAFRAEVQDLPRLPMPVILHWEFAHFLVLERLGRDGWARVVDPAGGRRKIGPEVFRKAYTGVALAFEPGEGFKPRTLLKPTLDRYAGLFRRNLPDLGLLLSASFFLQVAGIVFPVANQLFVDRVIQPRQDAWLWGLAFGMGLAMVIQTMLSTARTYILDTLQVLMNLELVHGFMDHLLRLPIGFFLLRKPGDLIQRLESHDRIKTLLSSQIITSVLDTFMVVGYGGLMLAYDVKLAAAVMGAASITLLFQILIKRVTQQLVATELAASGAISSSLLESLSSLEAIKAVGAERAMVGRWTDRLVDQVNVSMRRQRLEIAAGMLAAGVNVFGTVAVFGLAGAEVMAGRMTLGVFSAFLSLRGLFLAPFMSLTGSLASWQHLRSHLARLDDVMETEEEACGPRTATTLTGDIRLENVTFAYAPSAPPAVREVNLHIRPGEKIALVGPTGAGKSTLARLLLGMLVPTQGRILFDGVDLREYDLGSLRSRMGVVLQDTFLFNGTVADNLKLKQALATPKDLNRAARIACIDQVIEHLPQGYETPLGENGATLSGGERQRLSLARALLHEPAILLLDEATSSLDLETEAKVHTRLASVGCTRILIAHRIATVRDADRIVVMEDGAVSDQGRFEQLRGREGLFRALVEAGGASHA